jgi:hypothetical protein
MPRGVLLVAPTNYTTIILALTRAFALNSAVYIA